MEVGLQEQSVFPARLQLLAEPFEQILAYIPPRIYRNRSMFHVEQGQIYVWLLKKENVILNYAVVII